MQPHIEIRPDSAPRQRRERDQFRARILVMGSLVFLAWWAVARLPGMASLALGLAAAAGGIIVVFAGAMGLGWLGFGLFALCDKFIARVRRAGRWPLD
jgi:hypothetical protein